MVVKKIVVRMLTKTFRDSYSYTRPLPINFEAKDLNRFESIINCEISAASVIEICDAKVVQYYIFSGTRMLEELCLPVQLRGKQQVFKQLAKFYLFPKKRLPEAIWIIDLWSKNYFHWILECFPRILVLREKGIVAPLLIPEHLYKMSYINESLLNLGIEVITFKFRESFIVEKLHTVTHDSPCAFDTQYLKDLKTFYNKIDDSAIINKGRKIYISRRDATKRRILNEHELEPLLIGKGFEIVQMEKLSFKEQRLLMMESKILLSSHGAGFTNMIFMPPNSTIVELHPDTDRYNSCFYHLASALDLGYYYSFEKTDDANPQQANLTIDLVRFSKILDLI